MKKNAHRLNQNVFPKRYMIEIAASPYQNFFKGRVDIELDVKTSVSQIEMHARSLKLAKAVLRGEDGLEQPLEVACFADTQTALFSSSSKISAGAATLSIEFEGKPDPGMHGLYIAQDGQEKAVATQCEATDARAIFPCFDEPEFKARFKFKIRAPKELVALANGALQ